MFTKSGIQGLGPARWLLLVAGVFIVAAACGGDATEGAAVEAAMADEGGVDEAAAVDDGDAGVSASAEAARANGGDIADAPEVDEAGGGGAQEASGEAATTGHDQADDVTAARPAEQESAQSELELVSYDGSFSSTIQPILEEKCSSCHYDGGPGAFHWNLRSAQDVVDTHLLVESVITSNYMPPWPAAGGQSVAFKEDRGMRPDQVQAIVDWVADGAPIDVEASLPIEAPHGVSRLEDPDLIVGPNAPYAGDPANQDELRCLIYDLGLDDGGWLTGYEFRPDQTAVVHHAVGFVVGGYARDLAESFDGDDGRPGWSCPGGMTGLPGFPFTLWAPGQQPTVLPEGTGRWVEPGAFMVMQMHYHYDGQAPADNSSLALIVEPPTADLDEMRVGQVLAPVEIPCATWEDGPLCDRDAALADAIDRLGEDSVLSDVVNDLCGVKPADFERFTDAIVESTCTVPLAFTGIGAAPGTEVEIDFALLHVHELATWTRLTINKGTPDELILVDIPNWDFDWQYSYRPADTIKLGPTDTLTLECGWDRNLRDPNVEPAWILFADGTHDEMCTALLQAH